MSNRFPNANYPVPYTEANMEKADAIPVNETGTGVTVTDVTAPYGPLMEHAVVTTDVPGTTLHESALPQKNEPESAPVETEEPVAAPQSKETTDDPFATE